MHKPAITQLKVFLDFKKFKLLQLPQVHIVSVYGKFGNN